MSNYFSPLLSALMGFIIVVFIVTIPYIIIQYHKYGSILSLRILIIYSFILYLISAYFLVILPLPNIEDVKLMTGSYVQLIPFRFIYDIVTHVHFDLSLLKAKEIYQVFFNFLLTVPFGMYLKYYFKVDLKHTVLYTFLLSLFFELTQLTGLYFIYPRPYRLFDIDDLMINTLGGLAGYHLVSLFKFLPSREKIDNNAYERGLKVSFLRIFIGHCLDDLFLVNIMLLIYFINSNLSFLSILIISIVILFMIVPMLSKGYTIGKKIVNAKLVNLNDENCRWYQYIIRYFLYYLVIIGIPLMFSYFIPNILNNTSYKKEILFVMAGVMFTLFIVIIFYILIHNILRKNLFIFEKISKTKNISTIKYNKEEK